MPWDCVRTGKQHPRKYTRSDYAETKEKGISQQKCEILGRSFDSGKREWLTEQEEQENLSQRTQTRNRIP